MGIFNEGIYQRIFRLIVLCY